MLNMIIVNYWYFKKELKKEFRLFSIKMKSFSLTQIVLENSHNNYLIGTTLEVNFEREWIKCNVIIYLVHSVESYLF